MNGCFATGSSGASPTPAKTDDRLYAVVGLGYVGRPLADFLIKNEKKVVEIDISTNRKIYRSLGNATVFVCVPTPAAPVPGDAISEVVSLVPKTALLVIRSTVPPKFCQQLRKEGRRFVMWPEFLDAATAEQDFLHPHRVVIGADRYDDFTAVLNVSPVGGGLSKTTFWVSPEEACMVKYASNAFFLMKNVFFNAIHRHCAISGMDAEKVRWAVSADQRIGDVHTRAIVKGGSGAGGACLPKDFDVFLDIMAESLGGTYSYQTLLYAKKENDRTLKVSGKDDGRPNT